MIKSKKGAEKVISVYWFLILVLVAGGISYMVITFYGDPYEVREIESSLLINDVADCISENGELTIDLVENVTLEEKCNLNFNTGEEDIQYYIKVTFKDFETQEVINFEIVSGNPNLNQFYGTSPNSDSIFYNSKNMYVLHKDQEINAMIEVIIGKSNEN